MKIEELIKIAKAKNPKIDEKLINKGYDFAKKAHKGQKRASGEDYINHPMEAAKILANFGMDSTTLTAAILHDVPEDTKHTLKDIEKEFGKEIAFLVKGITKLGKIKLRGEREEYYLENLRKMFLAMAADIRTVLIKLADRYHNMQTLYAKPKEKQFRIAKETMEVFAPIANRLGIGDIKGDLEDMAFKYMYPKKYRQIEKITKSKYQERTELIERIIKKIKKDLKKEKIKIIDIHGRAKHLYRLYLKLKKHNMNIDEIYDLVAIRIVVPEIRNCYETLGVIHKYYKPLINRIKDYISLPKPNGYKSIHTTIFGPEKGQLLEVQIRTPQMHREAEFGIAAHWIYSGKNKFIRLLFNKDYSKSNKEKLKTIRKELIWVKQLRNWQKESLEDSTDFFKSLRIDFFNDRIFAFTPRGDVIDLPEGATPIDFAYSIHTEVGHSTIGAKVEGKPVPLDYNIQNGQVIEIITQKGKLTPDQKWLDFVKTSMAKVKIKQALKKQKKIKL
ncbi:MAG: RelA/SpoT family protein [Candidatus Moranbacteria bacterium]|nr:RelA/SpoT family protein [Candidatus Moranbacteria bacterium]